MSIEHKDPIGTLRQELLEEILGTWDAAEDCSETILIEALGEAGEKGEEELARKVLEGTVEMVLDIFLLDEEYVGDVLDKIVTYRKEWLPTIKRYMNKMPNIST